MGHGDAERAEASAAPGRALQRGPEQLLALLVLATDQRVHTPLHPVTVSFQGQARWNSRKTLSACLWPIPTLESKARNFKWARCSSFSFSDSMAFRTFVGTILPRAP